MLTCVRLPFRRSHSTISATNPTQNTISNSFKLSIAIDPLLYSPFVPSQLQLASFYFLHNRPRPPANASAFLQVSLSKILGNRHSVLPQHGSPRISGER